MTPRDRARAFCDRFGLTTPVLMGPMAGSSPPALAAAVAGAGGMGGCGAVLMTPDAIARWAADFHALGGGPSAINLWVPERAPVRDASAIARMATLLGTFDNPLGPMDEPALPDFAAQCDALIAAQPTVASSIMGSFPPAFVRRLQADGIAWFATVTSRSEAEEAAAAGADALVVAGVEAGGHRGSWEAEAAMRQAGTLFALIPVIADAVSLPLIAAGAIADGRGLAAALTLGASAVQIGTALLRSPEAAVAQAWADALATAQPEDTVLTRAYSGRLARAVRNRWTEAVGRDALPYPLQRQAVAELRARALADDDRATMQMWAGQAASLARAAPAAEIIRSLWAEGQALLA